MIDTVVEHKWPGMALYSPSFATAEAQCVLDKQRLCDWWGAVKKDPALRLNKREYTGAQSRLAELVRSRHIQRLELDPDHLELMRLASSVNFRYQVRRRSKDKVTGKLTGDRVRPPMGTADCLLVALAIDLCTKVGSERTVIVTADRRLSDVVSRCRRLGPKNAKSLGLLAIASRFALDWSPSIYPDCVDLAKVTDTDLAIALRGWPLPQRSVKRSTIADLSQQDRKKLYDLGQKTKVDTGIGPDSLLYTLELDKIQIQYAVDTGKYLLKAEIARQLMTWRKNVKSRPK